MKAVSADAVGVEALRNRVAVRDRIVRSMKGGIKAGDLRKIGLTRADRPDRREIVRLVQRRQRNVAREAGKNVVVDPDWPAIIRSAVNNAMPNRDRLKSLCFAQPAPCSRQGSRNVRYPFRRIRFIDELALARAFGPQSRLRPDTVDLPFDQAARLGLAVRTEDLELDPRRTGVEDENGIRWSTPRAGRCCYGARGRKGRRLHRRPCVNARSRLAMSV